MSDINVAARGEVSRREQRRGKLTKTGEEGSLELVL